MSLSLAIPAAIVVVAVVTAGCSSSDSNDQAAICSSLDQLSTSVNKVRQAQPSENGLSQIKTDLAAVQDNLQQVLADAKDEFSPQAASIKNDLTALKSAINTAVSSGSATDITLATDAAKTLGSDVRQLAEDAKSTC